MVAKFYDRQDVSNAFNGREVSHWEDLLGILEGLRGRPPFFCELVTLSVKLLVGIGPNVGCLQYSSTDGNPPYLMAVWTDPSFIGMPLEFLIGGTRTPIAARFCLPMDAIKHVATTFLETGSRSDVVLWQEI